MNTNNSNEYFYVEKNKFISNYLVEKFKLWIWDFDDTLIDTTTYYKKSMEPEDIIKRTNEELDIEVPNWRYFVRIVNYLVSRGVRVGIASFGTYKIIKAYMDRLFSINQRIFTDVNLKALCRDANGKPVKFYPNKNDFIEKIMKCYRIYEPIKVILFDDNMTNISDAMGSGIVGVKIIGKDDNQIMNRRNEYSINTEKTYFGEYIINKLETTLKRLEEEGKIKKGNPPNNLKNETFSAIGSRKVGTINKAKRLERERFLKSIKNKYDKEQELNTEITNNTKSKETFTEAINNAIKHPIKSKIKYKKPKKQIHMKEYFNENNQNNQNNQNNKHNNLVKSIISKESLLIICIILVCLTVLLLLRKGKKRKGIIK
jgi:hypothetical protein